MEVRVLDMPEGEDPDSLLRAGKGRVFQKAMEDALPLTEYRIQRLIRKGPTETERDRVALFRKALPILATVPSMVEREQYVRLLAPYHPQYQAGAAFAEEHIRQDVAGHLAGQSSGQSSGSAYAPRRFSQPLPAPPSGGGATEQAERHLLRALVSDDPALMGLALESVSPDDFVTERAQGLARFLHEQYQQALSLDPKEVLAALGDDPRGDLLADLLMNSEEPLTEPLVAGAGAHLKTSGKEHQLLLLKRKIETGQADAGIMRQFLQLQSELKGTPKSLAAREG